MVRRRRGTVRCAHRDTRCRGRDRQAGCKGRGARDTRCICFASGINQCSCCKQKSSSFSETTFNLTVQEVGHYTSGRGCGSHSVHNMTCRDWIPLRPINFKWTSLASTCLGSARRRRRRRRRPEDRIFLSLFLRSFLLKRKRHVNSTRHQRLTLCAVRECNGLQFCDH